MTLPLSYIVPILYQLANTSSVTIKDLYFNSHAIVIGISNYKDPNLRLTNPVNDAKAMANILKEKYGFDNIKLLLDKDATKEKLEEIFDDYIRGDVITEKDRLLVYYSGHGDIRSSSNQQGRQIEESFLIPQDAKPGTYASYVKMNTIIDNCSYCNAKHILLLLDSCFSGSAFLDTKNVTEKPPKITDQYLKRIISKRAIQAVAATDKNQPADDKSTLDPDHGAFTGVLLKLLNEDTDPDKDGILTASEVGLYLEKNVPRNKIAQNPISGHLPGSEVGEFIFNVFNVSKSQLTTTSQNVELDLSIPEKAQKLADSLMKEGEYDSSVISTVSREKLLETENIVEKGNFYYSAESYDRAIACYDEALKIVPKYVRALYNKSSALDAASNDDESIKCLDKILEIEPKNVKTLTKKGTVLRESTYDDNEAMACFNQALEIDPKYAKAWKNKGSLLSDHGKYEEAISCYDKALEIEPRDEFGLNLMGQTLTRARKYKDAIACFDKVLEINPKNQWARRGKYSALEHSHQNIKKS